MYTKITSSSGIYKYIDFTATKSYPNIIKNVRISKYTGWVEALAISQLLLDGVEVFEVNPVDPTNPSTRTAITWSNLFLRPTYELNPTLRVELDPVFVVEDRYNFGARIEQDAIYPYGKDMYDVKDFTIKIVFNNPWQGEIVIDNEPPIQVTTLDTEVEFATLPARVNMFYGTHRFTLYDKNPLLSNLDIGFKGTMNMKDGSSVPMDINASYKYNQKVPIKLNFNNPVPGNISDDYTELLFTHFNTVDILPEFNGIQYLSVYAMPKKPWVGTTYGTGDITSSITALTVEPIEVARILPKNLDDSFKVVFVDTSGTPVELDVEFTFKLIVSAGTYDLLETLQYNKPILQYTGDTVNIGSLSSNSIESSINVFLRDIDTGYIPEHQISSLKAYMTFIQPWSGDIEVVSEDGTYSYTLVDSTQTYLIKESINISDFEAGSILNISEICSRPRFNAVISATLTKVDGTTLDISLSGDTEFDILPTPPVYNLDINTSVIEHINTKEYDATLTFNNFLQGYLTNDCIDHISLDLILNQPWDGNMVVGATTTPLSIASTYHVANLTLDLESPLLINFDETLPRVTFDIDFTAEIVLIDTTVIQFTTIGGNKTYLNVIPAHAASPTPPPEDQPGTYSFRTMSLQEEEIPADVTVEETPEISTLEVNEESVVIDEVVSEEQLVEEELIVEGLLLQKEPIIEEDIIVEESIEEEIVEDEPIG